VHEQGVVHRDLKPANILFDGFGNPALSDFGIAQFSAATVELTGSAVIGTPSYMSPEQVRAESDLDRRSDIYALGVVLFEMLAGRQPYHSTTPFAVALMHLTNPVPQIRSYRPDLPPEVDAILAKALAKDREERYPTASALTADLEHVGSALPTEPGTLAGEATGSATVVDRTVPGLLPAAGREAPGSSRIIVNPPAALETRVSPRPGAGPAPSQPVRPARNPRLFLLGAGGLSGLLGVCVILLFLVGLATRLVPAARLGLAQPPAPSPTTGSFSAPATQVVPVATDVPPPTALLSPTVEPSPAIPTDGIPTGRAAEFLLSDDFSSLVYDWPTGKVGGAEYRFQEGRYTLAVNLENNLSWAVPGAEFTDAVISVEAAKVAGSDDNYYGLICRYQEPDSFYYFVIWGTGYAAIGKHENGQFTNLLPGGQVFSDAIKLGNQTNQIQAECAGQDLRLVVNGVEIAGARDDSYSEGDAGLAAAALDAQGVEVVFDNFVVAKP
jgi:hypothetical protein